MLIPINEPGTRPNGVASATVNEGRFVSISGDAAGGPFGTENPPVAHSGAGAAAYAVACHDALTGVQVALIRGSAVVPMIAGAAVAAGAGVQSDATGRAITLATGVKLGVAVSAAANAGDTIAVALDL